ncbi:MAG: hypothetical protein K0Q53_802 [Massilibacillus sp.]|jgi:diguanylate cyclase (GGDEF)-like protein|nr:hypothetical protein [Massilibacillus sp.]
MIIINRIICSQRSIGKIVLFILFALLFLNQQNIVDYATSLFYLLFSFEIALLAYFFYAFEKKSAQVEHAQREIINLKNALASHETAKKLLFLEKERYRITNQLTNDILFEYDVKSDILTNSIKFQEFIGKSPIIYNFSKIIPSSTLLPKSDKRMLHELYIKLMTGAPKISTEIRILNIKHPDQYNWWHINGETIYNDQHEPIKLVGKIINIDAQKKEIESLQAKAYRDSLTGLYNKMITQSLINELIKKQKPHQIHALMIIDIDNFKSINDTLGHLVGDEVLISVTNQLKGLFGKHDIVGRIGGDEFVVFMYNIRSMKDVIVKANAITNVLRTNYFDQDINYAISGSIGISLCPQDGRNYKELLKKADNALYKIKKSGKDDFALANSVEIYSQYFESSN